MPVFFYIDPICGREVSVSRDEIAAMLSQRFSCPIPAADIIAPKSAA
jgi:hypothetical protein